MKMETAKAVDGESEDRVNAEAEAATKETAEAATEKKDEEWKVGFQIKRDNRSFKKAWADPGDHTGEAAADSWRSGTYFY